MLAALKDTPKVLVVDDDPAMTRMISMSLRSHGFRVVTAVNGADALDRIGTEQPDVIVLDLAMPVMDGKTFFRQLRAAGDATPVVILSAHGARAAWQELRANDYLGKPFHPDDLAEKLEKIVSAG